MKLDHWSRKAPTRSDFDDGFFAAPVSDARNNGSDPELDPRPPVDTAGLWDHTSYEAILFGMDFRGEEFSKLGDDRHGAIPVPFVVNALQAAPKRLPPHHIWLHHALGMTAWEVRAKPAGWHA